MHVEIQVALNFLISFLYNKLPRRRVNQFAEELENLVKSKFDGHWYPEEPYKGSAYRCIHCNPQLDSSLFREAASNSGLNLQDVQENLPHELSIWIDPGEVSYRISEKGPVNILYSSKKDSVKPNAELGLNPEAQCFQPIKSLLFEKQQQQQLIKYDSPINSINPLATFNNKNDPVTFTTATFAATKFGSTKPKIQMNKKYQRGSPTETNQKFLPRKLNVSQQNKDNNFNHCIIKTRNNIINNDILMNLNYSNHQQAVDNQKIRNLIGWNCGNQTNNSVNDLSPLEPAINQSEFVPLKRNLNQFDMKDFHKRTYFHGQQQISDADNNLNLFESVPIIPDQLLKEIFDLSSNENLNMMNNHHHHQEIINPNSNETCNGLIDCSSSCWSSPLNILNEFDNLSLNSTSSSSLASVSSYAT